MDPAAGAGVTPRWATGAWSGVMATVTPAQAVPTGMDRVTVLVAVLMTETVPDELKLAT